MSSRAAQLAELLSSLPPDQRAALIHANRMGLDDLLGLRYETVADDRVLATLEVTEAHLQPYGLVHGGVYAAIVESVCSLGAGLLGLSRGLNVVGLENTTRFIRATRAGATLRAEAVPDALDEPERTRWTATLTDASGSLCATGRVTLAVLKADVALGGTAVTLPELVVPDDD